eukprot:TRINITY_DN15960_c0_g1_i2.p1 TRINITY_DN15960_c0_g1~~TRINITY_DN15960_c0_g1_i2.p1  ORF type:complete len:201 (+),score=74.91 TRINITY_DN15960_c0_g1_i2:505-1107(+)
MRHVFRRAAARTASGFCVAWLTCPPAVCRARNDSRAPADRVPAGAIDSIVSTAELPGRPWESPWRVVDTEQTGVAAATEAVAMLAADAAQLPPPPLPDAAAEAARVRAAQLLTAKSVTHTVDQRLRKATGALMPACIAALGAGERRRAADAVAALRQHCLSSAKAEVAELEPESEESFVAAVVQRFTAAALRLLARPSRQ